MYCDDSSFTVKVDVRDFNPEDLMVKVTGDFVEVQGKHEEKKVCYPKINILCNFYFFKRPYFTYFLFTNVSQYALCAPLDLCLSVFC